MATVAAAQHVSSGQWCRLKKYVPQGLKPLSCAAAYGTAEAVPLSKTGTTELSQPTQTAPLSELEEKIQRSFLWTTLARFCMEGLWEPSLEI